MLVWQQSSDELLPQDFGYDKGGNLTYRKRNGDAHYFRMANLSNALLADSMAGDLASQIVNFRYTANGARLREFFGNDATGGSDTKRFYYDGLGRPSGVRDFAHDAVPDRSTCLRYDPDGQLAFPCDDHPSWLTFDGHNVASTLASNRWVFASGPGVDDPLIALYRDPSAPVREFYWVTDGSGRQLAVGLEDGSLSGPDRVNYFFNGGKFAGGTDNATSFDASRFESTIAPKLSYFRNRIYDQETGRWTQEDPIGVAGGLNLYQFNGNNPVAYTDPFGLKPCGPPGSCRAQGVALGSGFGAAVGGIVALGCTLTTGGVCGLGTAGIVTFFSAGGAAFGGLVGSIVEASEGDVEDEQPSPSHVKNPDGSAKEAGQQYEEITEAQRKDPQGIQSKQKSKQRDRQENEQEAEDALRRLRRGK